jgi:hypothetical protein
VTQADRIRAAHAEHPELGVRPLARLLGVSPGSVQDALSRAPSEPAEPRPHVLQVRLSDGERDALRAAAEAEGVSMAAVVRRLAAGL